MLVKDGIGMVWGSIRNLEERLLRTERMLGDTIGPGDSSYTNYDRNVTNRTMDWLRDGVYMLGSLPLIFRLWYRKNFTIYIKIEILQLSKPIQMTGIYATPG